MLYRVDCHVFLGCKRVNFFLKNNMLNFLYHVGETHLVSVFFPADSTFFTFSARKDSLMLPLPNYILDDYVCNVQEYISNKSLFKKLFNNISLLINI